MMSANLTQSVLAVYSSKLFNRLLSFSWQSIKQLHDASRDLSTNQQQQLNSSDPSLITSTTTATPPSQPVTKLTSTKVHATAPSSLKAEKLKRPPPALVIGRKVREALANGEPIVALESTVITHGMRAPTNLSLARSLERIVAAQQLPQVAGLAEAHVKFQATAATIAAIKGQLVVGLSDEQLEWLALYARNVSKLSRRDLPFALANKLTGGTTVAATMALATSAELEGAIRVFATGGLGGVHSDASCSFDVSADLHEFARSPICVVSAGFKAFLDAQKSLELLETLGVPVVSLADNETNAELNASGQRYFPGFYFRKNLQSALSPRTVFSLDAAASVLRATLDGPLANTGLLLAVPPERSEALDECAEFKAQVLQASNSVCSSVEQATTTIGANKTPQVLARLDELTAGKAPRANIALIERNAAVAGELALRDVMQRCRGACIAALPIDSNANENANENAITSCKAQESNELGVVVVGATIVDMHVRVEMNDAFKNRAPLSGATFSGAPRLSVGGVGRNLAAGLQLLGHKPTFVTSLGDDSLATFAKTNLHDELGIKLINCNNNSYSKDINKHVENEDELSNTCFSLVLIDSLSGACEFVIANLNNAQLINKSYFDKLLISCKQSTTPLVVVDANCSIETLNALIQLCAEKSLQIFIEPTDVLAASKLVQVFEVARAQRHLSSVVCMTPNLLELDALVAAFKRRASAGNKDEILNSSTAKISDEQRVNLARKLTHSLLTNYMQELQLLIVTMDLAGVLIAKRCNENDFNDDDDTWLDLPLIQQSNLITNIVDDANNAKDCKFKFIKFAHLKPQQIIERPVSGSGAGDSFAAGFISATLDLLSIRDSVARGFAAAQLSLKSRDVVPIELSTLRQNSIKHSHHQ